jgi:hypothetical protein
MSSSGAVATGYKSPNFFDGLMLRFFRPNFPGTGRRAIVAVRLRIMRLPVAGIDTIV